MIRNGFAFLPGVVNEAFEVGKASGFSSAGAGTP
jgi:hypothetical protein